MDIGSIFLVLAVFLLVAWYLVRPFLENKSFLVSRESQELSHLLAERDRVLTALQELEFDFQLGKIPQEDFAPQRELMLRHGADILRQIDAVQQPAGGKNAEPESQASAAQPTAEDRIEAAVAARRLVAQGAVAPGRNGGNGSHADDDLEIVLAERRRSRSGKSAGFCHKCGGALQAADRFCPKCGAPVASRN